MDLILDAVEFATRAHHGQLRKYEDEPYIVHPIAVAKTVSEFVSDPLMVAAALLHDTVEDCDVTFTDISERFGPLVTHYVYGLTAPSIGSDKPRALRKEMDREFLAKQDYEIQTIKLADILDNTKPSGAFMKKDPKFFKLFMEEKYEMVKVLDKGHGMLWDRVMKQVEIQLERASKL
jgi:(p)ppGpp synthase/HD superfamily hydrolase